MKKNSILRKIDSKNRNSVSVWNIYKTKYGYKSINYQSSSKSNLSNTFKNIQDALCFYENSRKIKIKELLLKYDNLDKRVINKLNQIIK